MALFSFVLDKLQSYESLTSRGILFQYLQSDGRYECRYHESRYSRKRNMIIHVVGERSTGKTKLIKKFLNDEEFIGDTEAQQQSATLRFEMNHKEIENGKIQLTIYDCATADNVKDKQLSLSHGTIICFSINDSESFERVKEFWIPEIKKAFPRLPLLLVGTKRDLRDNARKLVNGNFIRELDGRRLAQKYKLKGYVECSSETDDSVEKVFSTFITG